MSSLSLYSDAGNQESKIKSNNLGKFLLTYGSLGPTEFRLIVILINTVFMYTSLSEIKWTIEGQTLGIFDVAGLFIACFLFVAWLVQFITDRRVLSKQDPLKPYSPKK